jgi:hypothetical protein
VAHSWTRKAVSAQVADFESVDEPAQRGHDGSGAEHTSRTFTKGLILRGTDAEEGNVHSQLALEPVGGYPLFKLLNGDLGGVFEAPFQIKDRHEIPPHS